MKKRKKENKRKKNCEREILKYAVTHETDKTKLSSFGTESVCWYAGRGTY